MDGLTRLTASVTIEGAHLLLHYEVTNHDRRDIYLLNRLYRTTPKWDMSPDVIYVHLDPAAETVWLSKKLADLPKDERITAPVAPFVTPVRVGSSYREEVRIPLPVREYQQYAAPPQESAKPGATHIFRHVRLAIGYYSRPDGTEEEIRDIQGTPVVSPKTPPGARLEFGELQSDDMRADVSVLLEEK